MGAASRPVRISSAAAEGLVAAFAAGLLAMHALRPDYAIAEHMISDYAVGPYGWGMTLTFLALAGACLALAAAIVQSRPLPIGGWLTAALLLTVSVGLVVTAAYPTDLPGAPATRSGDIHDASFRVNVGALLGAAVLSAAGLFGDPRWRRHRGTMTALTVGLTVAFALQVATLRRGAPYGLANRVFVVSMLVWLVAAARALRAGVEREGSRG